MERNVTIKIPESQKPTFKVTVNGIDYEYPAGIETDVPESVASVIDNIYKNIPKPLPIEDDDKEAVIEPLTVTENGEYTAPEGVDGYSPVNVNVQSGGGTDTRMKKLIEGTLTELVDDSITTVDSNIVYQADNIIRVSFPNAVNVSSRAFSYCYAKEVFLPKVEHLPEYCFIDCQFGETYYLPNVSTIESRAFQGIHDLKILCLPKLKEVTVTGLYLLTDMKILDLPIVEKIGQSAFYGCYTFVALVLRNTKIAELKATDAFNMCHHFKGITHATNNPNGDKDGYIYVPRALIEDYKVATNWTTFADQFRAIEDYTVDGTIDGEMDWARMGVTIE